MKLWYTELTGLPTTPICSLRKLRIPSPNVLTLWSICRERSVVLSWNEKTSVGVQIITNLLHRKHNKVWSLVMACLWLQVSYLFLRDLQRSLPVDLSNLIQNTFFKLLELYNTWDMITFCENKLFQVLWIFNYKYTKIQFSILTSRLSAVWHFWVLYSKEDAAFKCLELKTGGSSAKDLRTLSQWRYTYTFQS